MDTMEINIGTSEPRGHIIQNNNKNPAPKGRAFSRQSKTFDNRSEKAMFFLEEKEAIPTKLCVMKGPAKGHKFDVREKTLFVGRSSRNDIQIKDTKVSRKHLKIFRIGKTLFVEDLMSSNGTLINGEILAAGEAFEVDDGDTISIGNTAIGFGESSLREFSDTNYQNDQN